jgi:ribonuclease T2
METTRRGRRLLVSLSFLCLAVLLATASTSTATAGRKRRMAGFDYYVLALQWPGSVCRQTNHCCSSNGCCR